MNRGLSHLRAVIAISLLVATALSSSDAIAQFIPRPAEEMPEPSEPTAPLPEPPVELPPIAPPTPLVPPGALRVAVRTIAVRGSTIFSEHDFSQITSQFLGRPLTTADLAQLTQAITGLYTQAGYITSGAVLPDQDLEDGGLLIEVIEGQVDEILIEGHDQFRASYFRSRLRRAVAPPVQVNRVTKQLAIFQRHPRIERMNAILEPTTQLGVTRLRVEVQESPPWTVRLEASNERPPTIGMWGGGPDFTRTNLVGIDDELFVSSRFTEGLRQVEVRARSPINSWDTELVASYQYSESDVVDSPLEFLDIESEAHLVDLELRHPVLRTQSQELWMGVVGSWARTKSSLLGRTTCFQFGLSDCEPTVSVIRLRQDYLWRSRAMVFSARSALNFGFSLDLLDSTGERSSNDPDSEFVSWLGQVRWLQRISTDWLGWSWPPTALLVVRGDIQLSNDPLLSSEQIAIGGPYTVRGYRRNRLVRDNAMIGSVELRVPVWTRAFGEPILELGPFFDVGRATNVHGPQRIRTLSSIGLALRLDLGLGIRTEASYGYRLRNGADQGEGLQRDGLYLRVVWDVF
jgi:hemolysin activation/secretion protein